MSNIKKRDIEGSCIDTMEKKLTNRELETDYRRLPDFHRDTQKAFICAVFKQGYDAKILTWPIKEHHSHVTFTNPINKYEGVNVTRGGE